MIFLKQINSKVPTSRCWLEQKKRERNKWEFIENLHYYFVKEMTICFTDNVNCKKKTVGLLEKENEYCHGIFFSYTSLSSSRPGFLFILYSLRQQKNNIFFSFDPIFLPSRCFHQIYSHTIPIKQHLNALKWWFLYFLYFIFLFRYGSLFISVLFLPFNG